MINYYSYRGLQVKVGDVLDIGTVEELTPSRARVQEVSNASGSVTTTDYRIGNGLFTRHISPAVALYDSVTGKRLKCGDSAADGVMDIEYDDLVRFCRGDGQYDWLDTRVTEVNLRQNIEVRHHPEFAELEQLSREIVDGVPHVRTLRNRLVPAADCVFTDRYRLKSGFVVCADPPNLLVRKGQAGYVGVAGGRVTKEEHTKILTAGAHVGERAFIYDIHILSDGSVVLMSELILLHRTGGHTEMVLTVPEGSELIGEQWVESAAIGTCAATGERGWVGDMRRVDGSLYSREYARTHARSCEGCGDYFMGSTSRCGTCRAGNKYRIQSYGNRDACYMTPERDIPIKFGIELEVGCDRGFSRSDCARSMVDAIEVSTPPSEYAILKEDGSLSGCGGFEIVTRPDCPSVHKRIWSNVLAVPDIRKRMSSWTNNCCGIHIHVSKAPLSELWIGRMLTLINSDRMATLVHKVAGRGSERYTKYIKKKLTDGRDAGRDRYEALNTSGEHTIEFRIFRGTLAPEGFLKNIEFVEAVLAFCRPAAHSLRDIDNPEVFTSFVHKSRKAYPNLDSFLQDRVAVNRDDNFVAPEPPVRRTVRSIATPDQLTVCA